MARADANDTRKGNRKVTDLQAKRLAVRAAGGKPLCGSPLMNSRVEGHKNYGKTCHRPAGAGTDHPGFGNCSWHAGNMTPSKKSAARERVAHEVNEFKRFYGSRVEGISFEQALLEEMQRSVGAVRWIEAKIAEWGEDSPKWESGDIGLPPMTVEHIGFRSIAVADSEYQAWLRHYLLERRHLADICKAGIQAGIAKAIVELHTRQAELMYSILVKALDELAGIKATDGRIALVLPRIIREVTGAA